jgi:hypothetical protein
MFPCKGLQFPKSATLRRVCVAVLMSTAMLFWLPRPASADSATPQVVLQRLTTDGRSSLDEWEMVAPGPGRVAYYRTVSGTTRQLVVTDGSHETAVGNVGWPAAISWSPDGTALVYNWSASSDAGDSQQFMYLWRNEDKQPRILAKGSAVYGPFIWSPDGRYIAARRYEPGSGKHLLTIFDLHNQREIVIAPNHFNSGSWRISATWSPDSTQLCFVSQEVKDGKGGLWVCHVDGSHLKRITPLDCDVQNAYWSTDGSVIWLSAYYKRVENENWLLDLYRVQPSGDGFTQLTKGTSKFWQHQYSYKIFGQTTDGKYLIIREDFPDPLQQSTASGWSYFDTHTGEVRLALGDDVTSKRREWGDPCWATSQDGNRIFLLSGERDLDDENKHWLTAAVFDVTTGARLEVARFDASSSHRRFGGWPSLSSDGRRAYFTIEKAISEAQGQYDKDIYCVDLDQLPAPTAPTVHPTPPSATPPPVVVTTPPALSTVPAQGGVLLLPIQNIKAEDLIGTATQPGLLPGKYKDAIQLDKAQNALLFSGPPEMLAALQRDLQTIDIVPTQIAVDVLVMELSQSGARDLGLDSTYAKGRWAALLPIGNTSRIGPVDADGVPLLPANPESLGEIIYQGVGSLPRQFFVHLQALETSGDARIEASPRVVTTSGEPATIMVRQRVNFFYNIYYDGRATPTRGDISADINVKIVPILLGNSQVFLDVDALVGSFTFKGNSPLPDTTDRQVATRLTVPDGATFVLGGLKQNQRIVTNSKVPLLGDLPLLGNLFRKTSKRNSESTLAIMITPRVLKPGESAPVAEMGK